MNEPVFSCMVCGASTAYPWLTACPDYYLGIGPSVNYVECSTCSLVQQWPRPKDVEALYVDYPIHLRRSKIHRFVRQIMQRQVYQSFSENAEHQTLLDYGCGDGTYLRQVGSSFHSVLGFEPNSSHAATLAENLGVPVYGDKDELQRKHAATVDVITAHFVLEHVLDLKEVFRLFHLLLKPDGQLHIIVPNIRSWEARLFGRYWHGLDAPRHISFPDARVFRQLASAHGFEALRVLHAVFPNTLAASLATVLTERYHPALFMLLIPFSWGVVQLAPSGTLAVKMTKKV